MWVQVLQTRHLLMHNSWAVANTLQFLRRVYQASGLLASPTQGAFTRKEHRVELSHGSPLVPTATCSPHPPKLQ